MRCVFCDGGGDVHAFTAESLKRCSTVLAVRKEHKFRFNDVQLPEVINDEEGYHHRCYKNFTAVKKALVDAFEATSTNDASTSAIENLPIVEANLLDNTESRAPDDRTVDQSVPIIVEEANCPENTKSRAIDGKSIDQSIPIVEANFPKNTEIRAPYNRAVDQSVPTDEANFPENMETRAPDDRAVDRSVPTNEVNFPKNTETGASNDNIFDESSSENGVAGKADTNKAVDKCLFCNKIRKMYKRKTQSLIKCTKQDAFERLKYIVLQLNDPKISERLDDIISKERPLYYHYVCSQDRENRCKELANDESTATEWQTKRMIYDEAYTNTCSFIQKHIVSERKGYFLSFIHTIFLEYAKEAAIGKDAAAIVFSAPNLKERLKKTFDKGISFSKFKSRTVIKPYGSCFIENELVQIEKEDVITKAAFLFHDEIRKMSVRKLPEELKTKDLVQGECEVPKSFEYFYSTVMGGVRSHKKTPSSRIERLSKSFAQDLIHATSRGQIKTSKHITLGMAVKSLTNSKKLLNVLNRFGHTCSYTALEELETEAAFSSTKSSDICPEDILRSRNLCTGVAFNNFDRFVDSKSGKDTLHDTVGIIFQEVTENIENIDQNNNIPGSFKKRRRTFDVISPEIASYPKKPKLVDNLLPVDYPQRSAIPANLSRMRQLNTSWMISHLLKIPFTPMWTGYNALITRENTIKSRISYLTTINQSPTSISVVKETMVQSQQIAEEIGEEFMQVTYDLAVAKIALEIQSAEKPIFDNLFIHLGSFHIMSSYFKAVGKFINNCGLTNIMIDANMLASGSVNGFIAGKHFNRCKHLHPIMSLGLNILHFQTFLDQNGLKITSSMASYLHNFTIETSDLPVVDNDQLVSLFTAYEAFKKKTIAGEHGKTAQFYLMYVNFIEYYRILDFSVRTADFGIFKYILPKLSNLFFAFNHVNYARYLTKYVDNLLNIDQSHPGLGQLLERGSFGIRRTDKPFSSQAIDLTLEQTINANAANKLTGIVHMSNSIAARQRWCKTHTIRSEVISFVMEEAGLRKSQDVTADLQKSRIMKDTTLLANFIHHVKQNINPFTVNLDKESLFNISSGVSVTEKVSNCLLNIETNGEKQRDKFIKECSEDKFRFENKITKNQIYSFSDAMKKNKIKVSDGKVIEIRMQRDLFGRLLLIALEQSLDICSVLTYPLTSVPLALCHADGTICKTDKSNLLKAIESNVQNESPSDIDMIVYDGFFVLHTMKEVPSTFGNIAKKILQLFLKNRASLVIVTFDQYLKPSIKDYEHNLRGVRRETNFCISGPEQIRRADFSAELKNVHFKEELLKFLVEEWAKDEMAPFIGRKTLLINSDLCYKYLVEDGKVIRTIETSLSCPAHEEADTKIVFHVCQENEAENIVIRCSDTDILIIMLGNMNFVRDECTIWMHLGTGNNERFVNITKLHEILGESLCASLPAFHAFTGCDFNPSFFRKGKKRPLKILQESTRFQEAFEKLPESTNQNDEPFKTIEEYVCKLYGAKGGCNSLNQLRSQIFLKTYKFNDTKDLARLNIKSFDASNFPPSHSEFLQQIKRTVYISNIWSNAHLRQPTELSPTEHGWEQVNDSYIFKWFEGPQIPADIKDITLQPLAEDEDSSNEDADVLLTISDDEDYNLSGDDGVVFDNGDFLDCASDEDNEFDSNENDFKVPEDPSETSSEPDSESTGTDSTESY